MAAVMETDPNLNAGVRRTPTRSPLGVLRPNNTSSNPTTPSAMSQVPGRTRSPPTSAPSADKENSAPRGGGSPQEGLKPDWNNSTNLTPKKKALSMTYSPTSNPFSPRPTKRRVRKQAAEPTAETEPALEPEARRAGSNSRSARLPLPLLLTLLAGLGATMSGMLHIVSPMDMTPGAARGLLARLPRVAHPAVKEMSGMSGYGWALPGLQLSHGAALPAHVLEVPLPSPTAGVAPTPVPEEAPELELLLAPTAPVVEVAEVAPSPPADVVLEELMEVEFAELGDASFVELEHEVSEVEVDGVHFDALDVDDAKLSDNEDSVAAPEEETPDVLPVIAPASLSSHFVAVGAIAAAALAVLPAVLGSWKKAAIPVEEQPHSGADFPTVEPVSSPVVRHASPTAQPVSSGRSPPVAAVEPAVVEQKEVDAHAPAFMRSYDELGACQEVVGATPVRRSRRVRNAKTEQADVSQTAVKATRRTSKRQSMA
jgi:hypothetical protein